MKIGIFDSGIGGLTVLKELINNKPNNEYIYVGDTLNIPYGNKSREELFKLSTRIIDYLISKGVDMIIIACGTVSSNLGNILKLHYKIPIIDIISPTINYLKNSDYNNIGIIATHMTVKSHIFLNSLKDKSIYEVECPKLVPTIENNLSDINNVLNEYLIGFNNKNIDLLVLGCTHYPIVKENIEKIISVKTFNMATPILDMIDNSGNKNVSINYTLINDNIINNTKKILNNTYDINLIKLDNNPS